MLVISVLQMRCREQRDSLHVEDRARKEAEPLRWVMVNCW